MSFDIGKFLKHARRITFTFVHCVTFDLPSPLRPVSCENSMGSRLDYRYSLFAGTSVSNLARLQLVQIHNTLAWFLTWKSRFCRITPVLSDLHWLPVRHRINFKIATITFKVLQFQQPSYLGALITRYEPTRSPRSSSSSSICDPTTKTVMTKSKSFSSVGLNFWNKLTCHLSSISTLPAFMKILSRHIFRVLLPVFSRHTLTSCFVMSAHPWVPPS